ncbi:hypothetical protein BTVI_102211 [Pitangus sulphuratus]|nr:hypothetical protein BTVI_102211 [Pitangus sulphuratus]
MACAEVRTGVTLPGPTHSTISDERVAQLGDFVPRERHFPQEDLPALDHDFFALGVVLEDSGMPEDELSLLVIVIDTNPIWWGKRALGEAEQFTLSKCIDAVMVLGNSHLFMNRTNKLAVIASHTQESRFLYPGKRWASADPFGDGGSSVESNCSGSKDGKYELLTAINDAIAEEIKDLMTKTNQDMKSRILVIKAAEDSTLQYMNFMNVVFAAQKQSILVDACVLDSDSGLLQQACDITGGIYLKVPHMPSLLQYLLWVFLPDQEQRSQLVLPPPVHVDYRAACFCHRNLIEIGYVCSVCLSIFQPSFIHMSGPRVSSFFLGNSSGVNFSVILSPGNEETGKLQVANCSGSKRAGDWNLDVTPGVECTPDMKQLFNGSCFTGVFGGDVNPPFDQLCSSQSMEYTPEWFPFLCVQSSLDNTPFLGYFYHGSTSTPKVPAFTIPVQTYPGRLFTGYRRGDPIITEENEYFTIPQRCLAGQCAGNAPVAFLQDLDVKCLSSLESYKEGLPHHVRINTGTADFIQQNVTYRTITDRSKFITESEILTQRFTVEFLSSKSTNEEELPENPGYQVGKPVRAANINASDPLGTLNIWQPGLDPLNSDTNVSTGNLKGFCPDIPANLNIHIMFAEVGAVQGIPQHQILAVQISYSTVLWQFQCGLSCGNTLSSLPITASVQFIEVPAQPPVRKMRYHRIYVEFDCNQNEVCLQQLLYPLTRFYTGEPYSQCLAKGLLLAFLVLLAVIMSSPWFSKLWNR